MKQTIIISAVVSVLVVALGLFLFGGKPSVIQQTLGSVAGPDVPFPCTSQNGVTTCMEGKSFSLSSSTIASFKSPSATSTLRLGEARITTATTSAVQLEWGRDPINFTATTTTLGTYNVPASVTATFLASTTAGVIYPQTSDMNYIIPPNTWVNLKGGFACTAGVVCSTIKGYAVVQFTY